MKINQKKNNKDIIIITGANFGLGLHLKKLFIHNNNLLLIDKSFKKNFIIKKKNFKIFGLKKDLTDDSILLHLKKFFSKYDYNLSLLINVAGTGLKGQFIEKRLKDHLKVINLNIIAIIKLSYFALKKFKKNRIVMKKKNLVNSQHSEINYINTIVNISSSASFMPMPLFSTYSSSKKFVDHFTAALQIESMKYGANVVSISPSGFQSNFRKGMGVKYRIKLLPTIFVAKKIHEYIQKVRLRNKYYRPLLVGFRSKIMYLFSLILPTRIQSFLIGYAIHKLM